MNMHCYWLCRKLAYLTQRKKTPTRAPAQLASQIEHICIIFLPGPNTPACRTRRIKRACTPCGTACPTTSRAAGDLLKIRLSQHARIWTTKKAEETPTAVVFAALMVQIVRHKSGENTNGVDRQLTAPGQRSWPWLRVHLVARQNPLTTRFMQNTLVESRLTRKRLCISTCLASTLHAEHFTTCNGEACVIWLHSVHAWRCVVHRPATGAAAQTPTRACCAWLAWLSCCGCWLQDRTSTHLIDVMFSCACLQLWFMRSTLTTSVDHRLLRNTMLCRLQTCLHSEQPHWIPMLQLETPSRMHRSQNDAEDAVSAHSSWLQMTDRPAASTYNGSKLCLDYSCWGPACTNRQCRSTKGCAEHK